MQVITSQDNKKISLVKKLQEKKYRDEHKLYVAEGVRWITDATLLYSFSNVCDSIFVSSDYKDKHASLIDAISKSISVDNIYIVDSNVFKKISSAENSAGILGVFKTDIKEQFLCDERCLYLDKVRDPGNMGSIIRTALGSGFGGIVLDNCVDIYNPKTVRSTMSGILKLNFYTASVVTLSKLKQDGYKIISADFGGQNALNYKLDTKQKAVLVLGGETDGVSASHKKLVEDTLSIPMGDIESLNVGVSAGIIMYQLNKQKFDK